MLGGIGVAQEACGGHCETQSITVDDILLPLVGHASHFQEAAYGMKEVSADTWLVDGQYPFAEFLLNFHLTAEPPLNRVLTVAGLILELLNRVPDTGDRVHWKGLILEVVDMDNIKIDKVMVKRDEEGGEIQDNTTHPGI